MKNRKSLIIILLILTIGIVGLTIAYFANSSTITNTFNTNPYGTTVTEEFVSPDNWLPGTSTDKSLTVTNTGQVDEAVRISYTEVWTSRSAKNNNEEGDLPLSQNGNTAALIHFTNTDDWTTVTENGTTYRYYNYKLETNQTTSELLDYVTFNPAITNSSNCTKTESNGTKTITCNSTGTGYDDATYKLTFNIETIQYDKYKTAWGTNVNIAAMKPMNASQLALKSNPVSVTNYTDGNVHEMYTFNHDATDQTPALTDYRYIGNDPYNYIYFNCDDLNNQNEETCEVWRIIGVFDVERPDPNDNTQTITERRMKLVRGSALPETMQWDSNKVNEWSVASLNFYLNNEYLNKSGDATTYGLKNNSKSMIENTLYYLGGKEYNYEQEARVGSTNDLYNVERGNRNFNPLENEYECDFSYSSNGICIKRENKWIGLIGLMNTSDVYMIYGKEFSNSCYNDPYNCSSSISSLGWFHSIIQIQTFLLDPAISRWDMVNVTTRYGSIYLEEYVTNNCSIFPTLYLSSSVKIIDGDGSSSNPYKLGF